MISAVTGHRDMHPCGKLFRDMKYYKHNRSLHFTELHPGSRLHIDMIAGDMALYKETFYPEMVTLTNLIPAGNKIK